MKTSPTPYMQPATARALLALSRKRTAALREASKHRASLIRLGWDAKAAQELVLCHYRLAMAGEQV